MNKILKFFLIPLVAITLTATAVDYASAKRFGGGRSFGGSKSYSNSYSKPVRQQSTRQSMNSAANSTNKRPRLGGFGGFLGGMLAGSLLGSLFFGHPFSGGGFMDILLIGLLAFFALKFFRGRKRATDYAGQGAGLSYGGAGPNSNMNMNSTDYGSSSARSSAEASWGNLGAQASSSQEPEISVPAGFNTDEFLKGAKLSYTRLQKSWDTKDFNDVSQFVTPAVLSEIKAQAAQDPNPSQTDILMLDARLLEVQEQGDQTIATVYFDALLREERGGSSEQVREVWHFLSHSGGMWLLDGIQQLEA